MEQVWGLQRPPRDGTGVLGDLEPGPGGAEVSGLCMPTGWVAG